jgi:hypothetical protein
MMNLKDRRIACRRNFWFYGEEDVVVRCTTCQRLYYMPYRFVMRADGLVSHSKCPGCQRYSCVPMLKDRVNLAVMAPRYGTVPGAEGEDMLVELPVMPDESE